MDQAISSGKFGPTALKRINYCCMYLNVLLLLDIALPNGQTLDRAAVIGDREALCSITPTHSVNQAKLNEKAWKEWQRCLSLMVY